MITKLNPHFSEVPYSLWSEDIYNCFYHLPYPFYLISGMANPSSGGFSFLGSDPFLVIKSKGSSISIEKNGTITCKKGDPLEELRKILSAYKVKVRYNPRPDIIGMPFIGGAVGYFGYDLCHFIEKLPLQTKDDLNFPDLYFAFYDRFIAIDHYRRKMWKVTADKIPDFRFQISNPKSPSSRHPREGMIRSNFTKAQYCRAVKKIKDYIFAGDVYQVNLSQRFETVLSKSPLELFLRLQQINPAPFSALLKPNNNQFIISSSPERFLKATDGRIETRPIKGTRPRGKTPSEDSAMKKELFESIKDNAELSMIVDMERNDIGRVCKYGSVRVAEPKVLETYPTLHHLVATVEGRIDDRYDIVDLIKATFPGGSITGAPKIRAMEIIDELEKSRRNVYTGAIGYLGFDGNIDLSIAIRIIMLNNNKAYYQVGGGIIADSDPESEYEETLTKGKALAEALRRNPSYYHA
ncbi:MAG: aminodeoxychorismate synthase component I [Planctomycetota bacterium]|nr:aminodeoxychorismate synthase component I [Planctomycetota bacterium]MDI6788693.1 aminodeoxychorismate synthase component I [Planctomycetota bacterium]